ncbi:MAG: hypothetical protein COX78_04315, partial [Candidatus Levybacteria bacterium CG_4_10_14_0_2_um_filter_35_8]
MLGNLFNLKHLTTDSDDEHKDVQQANPAQPAQEPPPPFPPPQVAASDNLVGSSMQPNQRQDLSVMSHLDSRTSQALNQAQQEAKKIKQALIEPEQLLIGLAFDSDIFQLLAKFSVDVAKLSQELQSKEQTGTF